MSKGLHFWHREKCLVWEQNMHVCVCWCRSDSCSISSNHWCEHHHSKCMGRIALFVMLFVKCHSDTKPDCNKRGRHLYMWDKRDRCWAEYRMSSEGETNERGRRERGRERRKGRERYEASGVSGSVFSVESVVWVSGGKQSVAVPAGNTANASQQMKMNALNLSPAKTTP